MTYNFFCGEGCLFILSFIRMKYYFGSGGEGKGSFFTRKQSSEIREVVDAEANAKRQK